ncbi:MAG: hypothetical protein KC588_11990 [Nitrospira sp.]|nr:hypothetical protein [Nitrospira sp.]
MRVPSLVFKLRNILLHPSKNGGVSQRDPSFVHHLHKIVIAEFVGHVPADTQEDHLMIEMAAFEVFRVFG